MKYSTLRVFTLLWVSVSLLPLSAHAMEVEGLAKTAKTTSLGELSDNNNNNGISFGDPRTMD